MSAPHPSALKVALPFSARTALVDVNVVRAVRGVDADKVSEWIDNGHLQWVFNLAHRGVGYALPRHRCRELRFWAAEIADPAKVANLSLEDVLRRLLAPSRTTFRGSEIQQLLLISRPHLITIRREAGGTVHNHTTRISRDALVVYLRGRWLGWGAC